MRWLVGSLIVDTFYPNRGCSEIYHMPLVDYKNHKEGMPYELKFPFRPTNNNNKWPRSSSSPQTRAAGTGGTLIKAPPPDFSERNSAAIPRSVSSDGRPANPKRSHNKHDAAAHPLSYLCLRCMCLTLFIRVFADIPQETTTMRSPAPS